MPEKAGVTIHFHEVRHGRVDAVAGSKNLGFITRFVAGG